MTDVMKIGLLLGGAAIVGIGILVIATRPSGGSADGGAFSPYSAPPPPTQPIGGETTETTAVREGFRFGGQLATGIINLVSSREERASAEARRQAERRELLADRDYCSSNPNGPGCGARSANGSGGARSANA